MSKLVLGSSSPEGTQYVLNMEHRNRGPVRPLVQKRTVKTEQEQLQQSKQILNIATACLLGASVLSLPIAPLMSVIGMITSITIRQSVL